jgi:transcriptional regulator with XRE-family HTH domain
MGTGNYLEQWIRLTGLTQEEVGDKCGYEKTHFNKIVNGRLSLSRDKRRRISDALTEILGRQVNPDDLLSLPPIPFARVDREGAAPNSSHLLGKEAEMLRLARPMIATLVEQLGLEAVISEAVSASNRLKEGAQPLPPMRQKT